MDILIREKQISVNGINISYTDSGGEKEPLVFIHGFPFNKVSWEPQVKVLAAKRRVISYDIRGFGDSEKGREKLSIDLFASDLVQFTEALNLGKVSACGLSMGGYILMNAVSRFPNTFSTLVFCDTQCIADSEEGKEKRRKTIAKIEQEGLGPFAENFVQNVFSKETLSNNKDLVSHVQQIIMAQSKDTVTETLAALAERTETCNQLKRVKHPTLIVCGAEDTVTPLSQSELLNNTIEGSKLEIIEKAGHLSNLEQSKIFNHLLSGYLEALRP